MGRKNPELLCGALLVVGSAFTNARSKSWDNIRGDGGKDQSDVSASRKGGATALEQSVKTQEEEAGPRSLGRSWH